MAITDNASLPIAIHVGSASPSEITLVERTLAKRFTKATPTRLVGDKAYDSDPHDRLLRERYGTELIAPHRKGRTRKKTQDGRALRRTKRRWTVERFNAWIHNYRRVVVRWEYKIENYTGFVQLACMLILLRLF